MRGLFLSFTILFAIGFTVARPAWASFQEVLALDAFDDIPQNNRADSQWERFLSQARPGGTLGIAIAPLIENIGIYDFVKGKMKARPPSVLQDFVYETLMVRDVRFVGQFIVRPHLAETVELDPDELRVRLTLSARARFSDGDPVTTEHIVKSWEAYKSSLWRSIFNRIYGAEVRVEAIPARRQVEFYFPGLSPNLFRRAAFSLLSEVRIFKEIEPVASRDFFELKHKYLGTGPYRLVRANRYRMVMQRNSDYWANDSKWLRGVYNFAEIVVNAYMEKDNLRWSLTSKAANFYRELNPSYLSFMDGQAQKHGFKKHTQAINYLLADGSARALYMNMDREHLSKVNFRRALVLAWDPSTAEKLFADLRVTPSSPGARSWLRPRGLPSKEAEEILKDFADPLMPETLKPYEEMGYEAVASVRGTRERLRKATELLQEAGYSFADGKLWFNGEPVKLKAITIRGYPDNKRVQLFTEMVRRLGIEVEIAVMPGMEAAFALMSQGDFDFYPGGVSLHPDFKSFNIIFLSESFHSSAIGAGPNRSHLRSKAIDRSLEILAHLKPHDPLYSTYVEVFMRTLSAYMPFLLLGEPLESFLYTDPQLCIVPEIQAEELHKNQLSIKTGYFGCKR